MRDARRAEGSVCCPRCNSEMDELLFIAPALNDQGLIAYECPRCGYVSSVLVEPSKRR
jgi:transposase-like protein